MRELLEREVSNFLALDSRQRRVLGFCVFLMPQYLQARAKRVGLKFL